MSGRLISCMDQDGEFASDRASRQAAWKWLGDLMDEGKRWSEARSELAQYYATAGMDERIAHAKSKGEGADQAMASRFGSEEGCDHSSFPQKTSLEARQKEDLVSASRAHAVGAAGTPNSRLPNHQQPRSIGAQTVDVSDGLDQNLISVLISNFDAKMGLREVLVESSLTAQVVRAPKCFVLYGFQVRQVEAFVVRDHSVPTRMWK